MNTPYQKKRQWYCQPDWFDLLMSVLAIFLFWIGISHLLIRWSDITTMYLGKPEKATVQTIVENTDIDCIGSDGRRGGYLSMFCLGNRYYYYRARLRVDSDDREYIQEMFPKRIQKRLNITRGSVIEVRVSQDKSKLVIDEIAYGYTPFITETPFFGLGFLALATFCSYYFVFPILLWIRGVSIYKRIKTRGIVAVATIDKVEKLRPPYRGLSVRFYFRDKSGDRILTTQKFLHNRVTELIGDEFSAVGRSAPILYDPNKPKNAIVDWDSIIANKGEEKSS